MLPKIGDTVASLYSEIHPELGYYTYKIVGMNLSTRVFIIRCISAFDGCHQLPNSWQIGKLFRVSMGKIGENINFSTDFQWEYF